MEKVARLTHSSLRRVHAIAFFQPGGLLSNRLQQQASHTAQFSKPAAQCSICSGVSSEGSAISDVRMRASIISISQSCGAERCSAPIDFANALICGTVTPGTCLEWMPKWASPSAHFGIRQFFETADNLRYLLSMRIP